MCKSFSCVVGRGKKAYWKRGLDSHEDIIKEFKLDDKKMLPDIVRVEIAPKNGNYLKPDEWVFKVDERETPEWFRQSHENSAQGAFRKWKQEVYAIMNVKKILALKNPFKDINPPRRITNKHIKLLKEWGSVSDSVRGSVVGSVRDSVGDSVVGSVVGSVWGSVGDSVVSSVWDSVVGSVVGSVWGSVRDSVWGSVGDCFNIPRSEWRNTEKIKTRGYPFKSVVKLWNMGLVPSFDGTNWRLHGGKDAKVLFQITKAELMRK
jgi:hypothetical protein